MTYKKKILLSAVITVALIIILILPFIFAESAETIKTIIEVLYEYIYYAISLSGFLIALFQCVSSKIKKEKLDIIIAKTLTTCLIFAVPFSAIVIGHALDNKYDKIIEAQQISNSNEGSITDTEIGDIVETSTPVSGNLNIDYNDLTFSKISNEMLAYNKVTYAKKIYDDLVINNDDSIQSNKGYPIEFEESVSRAFDFENVYKYVCDHNYFINDDRYIRYELLNEGIELRKFANEYYQSFENQRLIGCRYQELATEYYKENKKQDEIKCYIQSIEWNMYAFKTSFKENCSTLENQIIIFDEIIECYSEIEKAEILINHGNTNDNSEKARLIKEIFEHIKEEYII